MNFVNALRDRKALMTSGANGILRELVSAAGKAETSRLVGHSLIVVIGCLAMLQPNPLGPWPASTLGWVVTMELFAVVGIFVYQSLLSHHSRKRVENLIGRG